MAKPKSKTRGRPSAGLVVPLMVRVTPALARALTAAAAAESRQRGERVPASQVARRLLAEGLGLREVTA